MSFRTVVITKHSSISYKNRFLIVREGIDEKLIHLSEIDTIVVDSIAVSISSYLLKELADNKINIIFCDEKHNPFGELITYYSSHNSSKKIMNQSKWNDDIKDNLWKEIVKNKITNQAMLLNKINNSNFNMLLNYAFDVKNGDVTNREGHAAKVYFNSLFGKKFVRNDENPINSALNYGYAILLSSINKEIIDNGYLTQLGIHHKNEFNQFNLSCDFMEPFRVIIDNFVYHNQTRNFDSDYKMDIINIFNQTYKYQGKNYTLKDIITFYVKNIFSYLENNGKYKAFLFYER